MKPSKILLIIVMTFILTFCTACEPRETEYDVGYNAGYDDGYSEGYDDCYDETYEDTYEYGYADGVRIASEKAYDYLYEEYGIDDDHIIEYCREP